MLHLFVRKFVEMLLLMNFGKFEEMMNRASKSSMLGGTNAHVDNKSEL